MAKAKQDPRDGSDDRFFAAVRGGDVTGAWYFCGEENYAKQKALEAVRGLLSGVWNMTEEEKEKLDQKSALLKGGILL